MPKTYSLLKVLPIYWYGEKQELESDRNSIYEINKSFDSNTQVAFEYNGKPKEKPEPEIVNGQKIYPRDKQVSSNALLHANFSCEINPMHPTFIRKASDKKYTEPHHLVPMSKQDKFNVSLDVEENIVSLCSNCHNEIHYGREAENLIIMLYNERVGHLKKVGINIEIKELIEMY